MDDVKRRAKEMLLKVKSPMFFDYGADAAIAALSADGLLVTPLHKRALEACKRYARTIRLGDTTIISIGNEALAAEKPKERWTAHLQWGHDWFARRPNHEAYGTFLCVGPFKDEAETLEICGVLNKRLNAEEGK